MSHRLMNVLRAGVGAAALLIAVHTAQAVEPKVTPVAGAPVLLLSNFDLVPFGFTTEEFFIEGTAQSYKADAMPEDGKWNAVPADSAAYKTRLVVVRPTDPKKFNGTVVVEWLNVSGGTDASPDWNMAHREILRNGYAYVGVSAQKIGIEGPPQQGGMAVAQGIKQMDPKRYASLVHPGDAYSYDIYSQAGQVVRATKATKVLGPLVPKHMLAMGESQSASRMVTYINAVDPIAKVYEGFLVHSRSAGGTPLQAPPPDSPPGTGAPRVVQYRSDVRVPVLTVEMETDVLNLTRGGGYHQARVADSDKIRVWEVSGTAHADNYSFVAGQIDSGKIPLEKLAAAWAPMSKLPVPGDQPAKIINNAPQQHYVVQAAMVALDHWVGAHKVPATGERMKLTAGDMPTFVADARGITEGGVRTPWVDAPVEKTSGNGNSGNALAALIGTTEPFDTATIDRLYPGGKAEYLKKFEASLDKDIASGFILAADKPEIMGLAALGFHGSH